MKLLRFVLATLLPLAAPQQEHQAVGAEKLSKAVEQLRHTCGNWSVTTEFLYEDGSVAKAVQGTYRFQWVVPDRVLSGLAEIPELKQNPGCCFM